MNTDFNPTEFISRLSGLESKVEEKSNNTERRLQKLETDNETLNRLVVVAELQQKTLETVTATLDKIGDSNQMIVREVDGLKDDISDMKTDVVKVTQKVENIEATDNVNIPQFFKKYGAMFFGAIVTLLAGYVAFQLGFKK